MTQTYFEHPIEERYTWFSGDKITKKVLDYVLLEPFVQQYVKGCQINTKADIESDHRLLTTEMITPTTKKARLKQIKSTYTPKPDPKSLHNEKI